MDHVVLLADASPEIGVGHVMRSITFGSELAKSGWLVTLLSKGLPDVLRNRAHGLGIGVQERSLELSDPAVAEEIAAFGPSLIIRDGYRFSDDSADSLDNLGYPIIAIDDNHECSLGFPAAIINQNLHAHRVNYSNIADETVRFLGPSWAIIREEISTLRSTRAQRAGVVVALGGTDPLSMTGPICRELQKRGIDTLNCDGSPSWHRFPALLAQSQLVIAATGSTTWEAACLGTPILGLITAENQTQIGLTIRSEGLGLSIDVRSSPDPGEIVDTVERMLNNPESLLQFSKRGSALVDGFGTKRLADAVTNLWHSAP